MSQFTRTSEIQTCPDMSQKTENANCCKAMTKECLACSAGYGDDVDSYCKNYPDSEACYVYPTLSPPPPS